MKNQLENKLIKKKLAGENKMNNQVQIQWGRLGTIMSVNWNKIKQINLNKKSKDDCYVS